MPLPVSLQELITARGADFDPKATRQEYEDNKETWQLYLDLYELDATKLLDMIEEHDGEDTAKFELRQKLAAVFNYVPTIVRMLVNYLHWEQPTISVGNDTQLQQFLDDCDGTGTPLTAYTRQTTLPLALIFGFIDTLVQSPPASDAQLISAADVQNADLIPSLFTVTPLQRIDWSTRQNHRYNWLRISDVDSESADPFRNYKTEGAQRTSFITISSAISIAVDTDGVARAFWIRHFEAFVDADGNVLDELQMTLAQRKEAKRVWVHDGDFFPTVDAPVATIYYAKSNDPTKRHEGLSKVAMICLLTKKIIQLLSWTDEDVLANLALFVFPGEPPKDDQGKEQKVVLTPFNIIWLGKNATIPAQMLQGATEVIQVKMKLIDVYIREILRLAYMIGASAEAEQITSGVQGVVARNELFMELSELAGALDTYTREVIRLAKSMITQTEVLDEQLTDVNVEYFKGPYLVDPLTTTIKNSQQLVEIFKDISPTMVQTVMEQIALAALYNEDEHREAVLQEIGDFFKDPLKAKAALDALSQQQQQQASQGTAGATTSQPDSPFSNAAAT